MGLCVVYVVCALAVGHGAGAWKTEYTVTGQNEGEVCERQNDQEWVCKKASDCEGLQEILKGNGKLKTCSWEGTSPVLCCPPKKESDRIKLSKSEEKCAQYAKLQCNDQGDFGTFEAQPISSFARRKRDDNQATDQLKEETTTLPTYPLYVIGGQLSKTGEMPSMIKEFPETPDSQDGDVESGFPVDSIVGGRITRGSEFPSMALIGYGDAGAISWQCGGSLISENYVLSAAHCVNTPYGLARWVRLGDLDIKSDTDEARPQQLEIVERVIHPGYRSPAFYNDIALFRLERPVVFDRFVKPACLHTDTSDPSGYGTAAGWGRNETHGPRSAALMQVDISFVPVEECKRLVGVLDRYLPNGLDNETMICAGEPGKDTCQGDSGGPLILPATPWASGDCLAKLVGVTSFGPKNCGRTSVPGAYVRVAHFLPWIEYLVWPE